MLKWIENSDFFFLQKLRKNDVDSCLIKRWGIGRFCPSMTFRNLEALPVIWLILPLISSFRIPWKRYALYTLAEHQNPLLIISWFAFYEHTWFIKGTLFVISSMATFISRECSRFPMIFPWFETWDDPFISIYAHIPIFSHMILLILGRPINPLEHRPWEPGFDVPSRRKAGPSRTKSWFMTTGWFWVPPMT